MSDARLPIKVLRIPGGAVVRLATGERLYIYGRDPEGARAAHSMTTEEAEALAKDVARALTEAWAEDGKARR